MSKLLQENKDGTVQLTELGQEVVNLMDAINPVESFIRVMNKPIKTPSVLSPAEYIHLKSKHDLLLEIEKKILELQEHNEKVTQKLFEMISKIRTWIE